MLMNLNLYWDAMKLIEFGLPPTFGSFDDPYFIIY